MVYSQNQSTKAQKKIRVTDFPAKKEKGEKITALTCYDASFARLLEQSDLDAVLVGDSLGNVIQGLSTTIPVTVSQVAYHVKCVAAALKTPLLIGDMPFGSAGVSLELTSAHAAELMRAGAESVKIEGATPEILKHIEFLVSHGIPVMGHIGLQPQSVHAIGGFKVQGKDPLGRDTLLRQAYSLQEAGCFSIVLELVEHDLAKEVSSKLSIPTIGIGSGNECDGNILVLQDMLGMNESFRPKFLKHFAHLDQEIKKAVGLYCQEVKAKTSEP